MSAADRLEDGYPHGTPDGYRQGCKGSHCPEADAGRLSCMQAYTRYQADYGYRRRVDEGMTPVQLAEFDAKVAEEKRALVAKAPQSAPEPEAPVVTPTVKVEGSPAAAAAAVVDALAEMVAGVPLEKHGTLAGYQKGCRDEESCPAIPTCREANRTYQREYKERKKANQERAAAAAKPASDEQTAAELRKAHSEAVGRAVAAEAELAGARDQIAVYEEALAASERLVDKLHAERSALVDRVASLEMELDVAKSAREVTLTKDAQLVVPPRQASPSRFRFQRDDAGGVVVDVDGEQPGFIRFDLDQSGALVGVAVQSGK